MKKYMVTEYGLPGGKPVTEYMLANTVEITSYTIPFKNEQDEIVAAYDRPHSRFAVRRMDAVGDSPAWRAIKEYVQRVNRMAERNMEKTGRLEGSHYAAMQTVLAEMEQELTSAAEEE